MNNDFERLKNFINSIGTTRILLQRAYGHGFLIEGLILYASLVDGFCRIALVLKGQIKNDSQDFNENYIFQDENNNNHFTERDIYRLCLKDNILDKKLFDEIEALYDVRNKAIHRFIITEIEYNHLELVLDRYELIYQRLWNIVYGLESEQVLKGVGMTISGEISSESDGETFGNISKKIDSKNINKLIKTLGNGLIGNIEQFSKENERNMIYDEISDEIEIQKEKKRIPLGYTSVKEIVKWGDRNEMFKKCLCGHEKIYHINTKQRPLKNNMENNIRKCNIKECKCEKYEI